MTVSVRHDVVTGAGAINAVIVDSQRLYRDALQRLLEASPVTVVGQGRTMEDALRALAPDAPLHLAIYNFLSDAEMEQELPNIITLKRHYEGVRVVILSNCLEPDLLLKAASMGVEAILSRDISIDVLQRALEFVLLGQHLLPTGIAQLLADPARQASTVAAAMDTTRTPLPDQRRATPLTPRESQILQCLMDGRSNKEIARDLDLTEATVKAHVKALLRKTRMTNRTQAAIWAVTNNFRFGQADTVAIFAADPVQNGFLQTSYPAPHRANGA
ncbi:LuxR family two component transcriptional regulator [Humitalea rosea]|uniref:LuxR family two component transcriptional regulator n=1 Tax=Humitalea rosea TaxID=990373 RepID=A0A2W7IJJ2_9PROT|nr:response regulator transcription factor [Humitalea rosea]PZW38693.1 LuxR family two component transcriptional regulator [Humitalea rosea]